jgi:hypothetical protein
VRGEAEKKKPTLAQTDRPPRSWLFAASGQRGVYYSMFQGGGSIESGSIGTPLTWTSK